MYHGAVLALLLAISLAVPVEVERVLAVVNGAPILSSDLELAELARLVPREPTEDTAAYRAAEVEALIVLELRWQDLEAAAIAPRVPADLDAAWSAVTERVGGEDALRAMLAEHGLPESALRELVRRAAIVEAYVAGRFAPFVRPTAEEVEAYYRDELSPKLRAAGKSVPELAAVREQIESLLRERKLDAEVQRWTDDLAKRSVVVRYEIGAPETSPPPSAKTQVTPPPTPGGG